MSTNPFFALLAAVALATPAAQVAQAAVEPTQQDEATTSQSMIAFELPTDGTLSDPDSTSINFGCAFS
ncbi:hypothetical protein [Micromonospora sp. NBC_01813]|uniref:hypothetical protein n=1 Tax=Micromonospora sp. NBC_01813 TaxID=2975988 RepID=UPI002DD9CCB8|nr:hypothetical protein [Micromonospora sp. NBC_01813]WSA11846.1 hypothetical protein OG958_14300 [Micromonospora sp. NBC_01813]